MPFVAHFLNQFAGVPIKLPWMKLYTAIDIESLAMGARLNYDRLAERFRVGTLHNAGEDAATQGKVFVHCMRAIGARSKKGKR